MRATFLAGGEGIAKGEVSARTIDLAPTLAFMLGIAEPQQSQGRVLLDVVKGGNAYKPLSIIGLNDFHGQLEQTTLANTLSDGLAQNVGGRRLPRDDVRRGLCGAAEAGPPAGGGRQRRRVAAELRPARGHAGDRCRERVGARRHVVRQPRVRLRRRAAAEAAGAGEVPVPGDEHRREGDREGALVGDALQGVHDRRRQGRRHRRRAEEHSGARLRGCDGRPRVPRRGVADQGRVGAPPRGRCTCPGRRHPPGNQHR